MLLKNMFAEGVNFFPLFLFYVDSCFPCMHVCTQCVYSACGNQKGVLDPQTRVTATCEQPLLITAEQSLQLRGLASLSPFLPLPSLLHPIRPCATDCDYPKESVS